MGAISLGSGLTVDMVSDCGVVTEEIEGLIRVYKDGYVERPETVPCVPSSLASEPDVTSLDMVVDKFTGIWARIYFPTLSKLKLPLIVYFHGGGFCVGSAAWICYHEFLSKLASKTGCLIISVDYRLAPENTLPTAYEDGVKALMWLRQQALSGGGGWSEKCDFSKVFLAGDSAGANIAYNAATRQTCDTSSESLTLKPLTLSGIILIQPFFGGETRSDSEKYTALQPSRSALSLPASDTYWRLALPCGANRDHPWCNPLAKGSTKMEDLKLFRFMVCVSDMDILKDRNLEFVDAMVNAGNRVEHVVHEGVGHAFQVLSKSKLSQIRTLEMISKIKRFINGG
ncbi:hypothetical protein K2173_017054 [Erythroxylum novogranatense]|uniref:Alpha/beta hydrolase fold-3 domain-containing protein n=1 Tax=Erythroxylum novogranatense TaxID=1862640 RepID=A0AAV8U8E9_9ROSI|nr:hypothetical protein K2173_017054 [Erythroxylum novogranatense]